MCDDERGLSKSSSIRRSMKHGRTSTRAKEKSLERDIIPERREKIVVQDSGGAGRAERGELQEYVL